MGFHDHGGAGVVHLTSGFAGMIGTYILGPRIGVFKDKTPKKGSFEYTRQLYKNQQQELNKLAKKAEEMRHQCTLLSGELPSASRFSPNTTGSDDTLSYH